MEVRGKGQEAREEDGGNGMRNGGQGKKRKLRVRVERKMEREQKGRGKGTSRNGEMTGEREKMVESKIGKGQKVDEVI